MCGFSVQCAAREILEFFTAIYNRITNPNVIEFSYGLGYVMLIVQFTLFALGCLAAWLTRERSVT